jgi:alkanesulfonate monooxygenase SsuD/methylene tetrahydromethanopterin reductase-like flavin-dependent oxidoreductase (luciferase family)
MKIGIGIPNQIPHVRPSMIPEWAARSEEAGFSTLTTVGRIAYPGVMDTVALAAAAGATSTVGLMSSVLLGTVWPPELLAKEAAGINGVSGGRLTLGLGLGGRPDDFVVDGIGHRGLGERLDRDVEIYRDVWAGKPVGGGHSPAVPAGTPEVPVLFGGFVQASFDRVARLGQGFIGATMPAAVIGQAFEQVRAAWKTAGREGAPRLVATAYFALAEVDKGRHNVRNYYSGMGEEIADQLAAGVHGSMPAVKDAKAAFEEIGTDELIFIPTRGDLDEIARLANIIL